MPKVFFKEREVYVEVPAGTTIYDAAVKAGIDLGGVCGGRGFCGKCRVRVQGPVSEPTELEIRVLGEDTVREGVRLACQARVLGDIIISIIYGGALKTAIMGYEPEIKLKPAVEVIHVRIPTPSMEEYFSTVEAVSKAIGRMVKVPLSVLRRLSERISETAVVIYKHGDSNEVIDLVGRADGFYGLAVDIGTTKIAVYVVDLATGDTIMAESLENPQVIYGADVVSRIAYAMEHGAERLHRAVIDAVNKVVKETIAMRGIDPNRIYDVVVVGNSVMHHLFLGINPSKIGVAPYEDVIRSSYIVKARELGLLVNPEAYVYMPPLVGGFIGSDSLVGAFILGIGRSEGVYMFMDIGTNTEVYLAKDNIVYAASTASGPAFEGGHIKFGMRAVEGAIEKVVIDENTLEPEVSVIGGVKPRGIAGSGIIDAIAWMLRTGIIDYRGRFKIRSHPRIRKGPDGYEYILVRREESGIGRDIVITQRDVREVQKAKAAIQTAFKILSRKLGITRQEVNRIYIAGSFGFYLRPENAIIIGLLPEIPKEKIVLVGNTAGSGARALLKNVDLRREIEDYARKIKYIELAVEKDFQRIFIDSTYLPSRNLEEYPETIRIIEKALK